MPTALTHTETQSCSSLSCNNYFTYKHDHKETPTNLSIRFVELVQLHLLIDDLEYVCCEVVVIVQLLHLEAHYCLLSVVGANCAENPCIETLGKSVCLRTVALITVSQCYAQTALIHATIEFFY